MSVLVSDILVSSLLVLNWIFEAGGKKEVTCEALAIGVCGTKCGHGARAHQWPDLRASPQVGSSELAFWFLRFVNGRRLAEEALRAEFDAL